jgi:transposase
MKQTTILNRCHRFPGFVYWHDRFSPDKRVSRSPCVHARALPRFVRAVIRQHPLRPVCRTALRVHPRLGGWVFLLYVIRHVDCQHWRAVIVEEVPWGNGKHQLTNAYMLFLARWARRLSWKEMAYAFRTSWDKVFDAVEHVVRFGLEHRTLGQIDAIGVDEIQYSRGHKYLTLVYQIDLVFPICFGSGRRERSRLFWESSPL